MSAVVEDDTSGTWRRYRHVLWTDVLSPAWASLVFFAILVAALLVALPLLQRAGTSQAEFYRLAPTLIRQPALTQLLTAISDLVLLFFLWRIARRVSDAALVARYRPARRVVLIIAALGGMALAVLTMIAIAQLASHSIVQFHPKPDEQLFAPGPAYQYPIVIFTVALVAPFVEEFYFRGVLLSWLGRKITLLPAVLVSALLFGLAHLRFVSHPGAEGWVLTGIIVLVGLVNAVLAIRTRSLWPPFFFHAGYNSALVGVTLLAPFLR